MSKKQRIEDYVEAINGKLKRLPNGDVVVMRHSKTGKAHIYQMHFRNGKKTENQMEQAQRFKKARAEADRQLKVRACRMKWEVSYRATDGVLRGKRYVTLRGYVLASCYQMVGESEEVDRDGG